MAKFNTIGLDDMIAQINRRTTKAIEKIPKMLEAGAAVLVEAQKREAKALDIEDTGDFIKSIKSTKIKTDSSGNKYVEVYPHGNDRKGSSNAEKGFIAEYGRTGDKKRTKPSERSDAYKYGLVPPRPWMSTANEKAANAVEEAYLEAWMEGEE